MAALNRERKFGPSKCPVYLRLPYKGNISVQFEKRIKSATSKCFKAADPRVIHVTKPILPSSHKDVLPSHSQNNVIYKFTCRCAAVYVGRTSQRLGDRIKQHVPPNFLKSLTGTGTRRQPQRTCVTTCEATNRDELHASTSTSAILEHLAQNEDCALQYAPSCFTILCRARTKSLLHILEAWYVKSTKPQLCKQK